jgi:hypothetical protein
MRDLWELFEHLVQGRPIRKHIMLGLPELLILLGIIYALTRLIRSRTFRDKVLHFLRSLPQRRAGRLLLISLAFGLFALLLAESASRPGHDFTRVLCVLSAITAFSLFLAALARFLGRWLAAVFTESCPPIDRLKAFLADRLLADERIRLAAHLEGCPSCQHRVEGLTAGQQSWPGMARRLSERPAAPEPALQRVMERLKEEGEEGTSEEAVFCGDLPLGFLSPSDKPGQLGRLERYEVLEEIGRGGMGVVLKAFDPSLHRVVAIKVLAPQLATSGVARKRFLREARAAAAVTHDNLVTIHAVDEANGLPYLVMQYVAGGSLQDRLDREGPLELAEVLRIGMQTAAGLAAAHAHGIVHRDIKPANILLEEGMARVRITDFGLARAMDEASLTQSGFVAGSPLYMAPEQARGEALDHRADLFSLGSVLYTMVTGRPPFRAANTLAVLRRVCEDAPRPIRETHPEVPDWFADVVAHLMAKEPAERFQSATEAVEVLGQHLAQLQHAAWVPPPPPASPAAANGQPADLPTSVTLCPSCGASLHVPERMVGGTVHCAECGKPFRVEDGSEVMQVARPARWPLGNQSRPRRKLRYWVWIASGCALLLLFLFVLWVAARIYVGKQYTQAQMKPATVEVTEPKDFGPPGYWLATVNGLPPEPTLFGAFETPQTELLPLDDPTLQTMLRLFVSKETADQLTPENLGRIRLGRVALGYYDGPKGQFPRAIVRVSGVDLSGHKRAVEFIRRTGGDKVQIEELDPRLKANGPVCISSPDNPVALKIVDDNDAYLAVSLTRNPQAAKARQLLDRVPASTTIAASYNPPWVKLAVPNRQSDACGFLIGEIPAEWRKPLTDALHLRVCPGSFVCRMNREGAGMVLYLTLNVERAGADLLLRDDLEKGCRQPPLTEVGQTLSRLRWTAHGDSVRTQMPLSRQTWTAVLALLKRCTVP